MQYVAQIERDGENTLIEFPDCPGCQTFAAPSLGEEVMQVAREAVEGWLASHLSEGDVPPRPLLELTDPAYQIGVHIAPSLAIALQVRWRRQELGLSQAQLGKLLGVSRQQASSFENPDANLRLSTLERLAEALQATLDVDLVGAA